MRVCVCVCVQVEEKTCGEGPCLEAILEDDVNIKRIIQNIKVCVCVCVCACVRECVHAIVYGMLSPHNKQYSLTL